MPPPPHLCDDDDRVEHNDSGAEDSNAAKTDEGGGHDQMLAGLKELRGLSRMNSLTSENLNLHDAAWCLK